MDIHTLHIEDFLFPDRVDLEPPFLLSLSTPFVIRLIHFCDDVARKPPENMPCTWNCRIVAFKSLVADDHAVLSPSNGGEPDQKRLS
jgi:hypothetical protein